MNHYAAEQLTRQRHDQFTREVRGDHLMRAALSADPMANASVVRSPMRHVGGLMKAIRERSFAFIPRLLTYDRIVIEGPRFVGLRLTPAAYRHGLALALPEAVMARPTGVGRAHAHSGFRQIPIEGAEEWKAAVRTSV